MAQAGDHGGRESDPTPASADGRPIDGVAEPTVDAVAPAGPPADGRTDRWRVGLRAASAVVLGSIALGVVLGAVWVVFAPRVDAVAKGGQPVPVTEGPEQYAGADALFIVLFAVAGVLVAVLASRAFRPVPWGVLAGVVIGGLIGSVVAAGVGGWLGWTDPQAQAQNAADGAAIVASAELRTPSALLIWPFLGALTLFFAALFGPGRRRSAK